MFHPEICERRLWYVQKALSFPLHRYSVDESIDRAEAMPLWNKKKKASTRKLTTEEMQFAYNECVLSTWDFKYWIERYSLVVTPGGRLSHMKLWESQEIGMEYIAIQEKSGWTDGRPNGWIWLKARQLGATQLAQNIMVHRLGFHDHQRGVIASDDPTHTSRLFRRFTGVLDNLPWWMAPAIKDRVKTDEGEALYFHKLDSSLVIGHGRKKGGGIAQGDSTNVFHLTELPDWENFKQIDADFLPTFHSLPNNVGIIESTARQRQDDFHQLFQRAWDGKDTKLRAMFIPYYAHSELYRMNPPDEWRPNPITIKHAEKVTKQSPGYCHGRTVKLERTQMYWWEQNYTNAKDAGKVSVFLSEFASDHYEAFQHQSVGMFDGDLIHEMHERIQARTFQLYHLPPN